MDKPPDPATVIEGITDTLMMVLMAAVHEHVPKEHRAAVLRHLANKINLELRVRTLIEQTRLPPPQKDDR